MHSPAAPRTRRAVAVHLDIGLVHRLQHTGAGGSTLCRSRSEPGVCAVCLLRSHRLPWGAAPRPMAAPLPYLVDRGARLHPQVRVLNDLQAARILQPGRGLGVGCCQGLPGLGGIGRRAGLCMGRIAAGDERARGPAGTGSSQASSGRRSASALRCALPITSPAFAVQLF